MTPQKKLLGEELEAQHQRIETMAQMVRDASGEEREQAFLALRRYLAAHEAVEQSVMHPTFRALGRDDGAADARVGEEDAAADAVASLEAIDVDSDEFTQDFDAFAQDVHDHAEREEHDELPSFASRMTDEDADEIVAALRQVESIANAEALSAGAGAARFADMLEAARAEFDQRWDAVSH